MDKLKSTALMLAAVCLLAGCAEKNPDQPKSDTEPNSSQAASDKSAEDGKSAEVKDVSEYDDLPLLEIVTKSSKKNVMNFVTKPVAKHVSETAAQWDPSFRNAPEPYDEACTVSLKDPDGTSIIAGADADVKVRGNWTTSYDKKPLRIKFDKKQSIPSLNGGEKLKNWVLLASYKDGSLMRDKTAFDISKALLGEDGLYCSDCQLVEVTINGNYWGVYLLAEQQQVNKHRIDITEPEKGYEGTDIGYFLEFDGYYGNEEALDSFYVSYNSNAPLVPYDGKDGSGKTITCLSGGGSDVGMTIHSDINSKEQHDFIASYINKVYTIMYEAAYNDTAYVFTDGYKDIEQTDDLTPQQAVEKVVDLRSLADAYILNEVACDTDLYWSSFFMDADFGKDGDGKLTFEAPWDFDSAFGNKDRCASGEGFYAANILWDVNNRYKTVNPWLTVLMYEDWYQDIIRERWTTVYDEGVFTAAIDNITAESERAADAIGRNYDKWNNIINNQAGSELCARSAACKTQAECAEYLAEWLTTRVAFLNEHWHN